MSQSELKVQMFTEAILKSDVAVRKGASVEIIDGKIIYFLNIKYKMRSNYREVLSLLHGSDMRNIHNTFSK